MTFEVERIATALELLPQVLHEQARGLVVDVQTAGVAQARQNLSDYGAIDTQVTFDGILPNEPRETDTGWIGEVRATAPQSIFVERGRRAGAPMPPGGVLLGWLERQGIPASAEFAIRRAIGLRGIPPKPFMSPLGEQLEGERIRLLRGIADAIRLYLRGARG